MPKPYNAVTYLVEIAPDVVKPHERMAFVTHCWQAWQSPTFRFTHGDVQPDGTMRLVAKYVGKGGTPLDIRRRLGRALYGSTPLIPLTTEQATVRQLSRTPITTKDQYLAEQKSGPDFGPLETPQKHPGGSNG